MKKDYVYKPFRFFIITFLITWSSWFIAAYLSHNNGTEIAEGSLMGLGLLGPLIAALIMIFSSKDKDLKKDFRNKLTNGKLVKPVFLPFIILFMPLVMIISIFLSLPFGGSSGQFELASEFNIMEGQPLLSLIIPFLAPALEELGWSGYGIDSLKGKSNILKSSALFGIIWSVWHLPLFFIKGYYHYNLLDESFIYAINFFISVVPLTIITNWLYFRNNRSIIAAIVFHAIVVVSCEIFLVTNFTKCIVTVVITILSLIIVLADKKFFFKKGLDLSSVYEI